MRMSATTWRSFDASIVMLIITWRGTTSTAQGKGAESYVVELFVGKSHASGAHVSKAATSQSSM